MRSLHLEFLFYVLGAGEATAPQSEATTASIVVQASSLQLGLLFLHVAREKERESKLTPAQSGIWEREDYAGPKSRVHAACFEIKGQPFIAGLSMRAMIRLTPVSNGLFFRLQQ